MTTVRNSPGAPRLCAVDGLRLLATVGVGLSHFVRGSLSLLDEPLQGFMIYVDKVSGYGSYGVDLFFIISGFVILMSAWGKEVPTFVASRIARIFPAFWFILVLTMLLTLAGIYNSAVTWDIALMNATLMHPAFAVPPVLMNIWTLWAELRFYLFIAIFMIIGITPARVLGVAFCWPILAQICHQYHFQTMAILLNDDIAPLFAGGMVIYLMYRCGPSLAHYLVLGVNVVFVLSHHLEQFEGQSDLLALSHALVIVGCFFMVWACTMTPLAQVQSKGLVFAGTLTYPFYLLNGAVGVLVINYGLQASLPFWLVVLAAFALTFLCSYLLYLYVDNPGSTWLRRRLRASLQEIAERRGRPLSVPVQRSPLRTASSSQDDDQATPTVPSVDAVLTAIPRQVQGKPAKTPR